MPDPNKIEGGRWDRVLRGRFNLKGAGPTAARISDDISPTFNFPYQSEDAFLVGDKLMMARGVSGPNAGQNARIILTNSSDNILVILEKIVMEHGTGGQPYFGVTSVVVPFVAAQAIYFRDGRFGAMGVDVGIGNVRFQDLALVGAPVPVVQDFSANDIVPQYFPDVILAPGDSAFVTNATTNTTTLATFYWREHLMEPSEVA